MRSWSRQILRDPMGLSNRIVFGDQGSKYILDVGSESDAASSTKMYLEKLLVRGLGQRLLTVRRGTTLINVAAAEAPVAHS